MTNFKKLFSFTPSDTISPSVRLKENNFSGESRIPPSSILNKKSSLLKYPPNATNKIIIIANGPWSLFDNKGLLLQGEGNTEIDNVPLNTYTTVWDEITGYLPPSPVTLLISKPGSTITFSGSYTENNVVCTCTWEPLGTLEQPYHIKTLQDLNNIRNDLTAHYALCNDIDASETTTWNDGTGWEPIGNPETPFTGSLDGQFNIINNLYINRPTEDFIGLFGFIYDGAKIKNLKLINTSITGKDSIGSICGKTDSGSIINCSVNTEIIGSNYIGGLVGTHSGQDNKISNCYSSGSVTGISWIGGLVGYCERKIEYSYSQASVTALDITTTLGGLVGWIDNWLWVTGELYHCYATGAISYPGEFAIVGGLAGYAGFDTSVNYCYWDKENTSQEKSDYDENIVSVFGKTTAEMKQQSTYESWDFDTVWIINDGIDYPKLRVLE